MGVSERIKVKNEAQERVKSMEFGDPVTNVCAGPGNPRRHAYFCQLVTKTRKNRFGLNHTEHFVKCTDRKGKFWNTDIEVIFAGHIEYAECEKLFAPIWSAHYQ